MILRPLVPAPATSTEFLPAWSVVEQSQRQIPEGCWMIPQPSHAALAGEFAARMTGVDLPNLDAPIIRAIALHDAGWGMPDAQAIMQSRSIGQRQPKSFIACGVSEFLNAWEKSIDVAASASAAGGRTISPPVVADPGDNGLAKLNAGAPHAEKVSRDGSCKDTQL